MVVASTSRDTRAAEMRAETVMARATCLALVPFTVPVTKPLAITREPHLSASGRSG